jgi:hypothetical protein
MNAVGRPGQAKEAIKMLLVVSQGLFEFILYEYGVDKSH